MSEDVPSLGEIAPDAQRLALAYYEAGLGHGFQLGYRAAEADHEAAWAGLRRPGPTCRDNAGLRRAVPAAR